MSAEVWTCPTCARSSHAAYCADCGERAPHAHDLTLVGLAEQAFEAVAHVDGRVFHTFRALLFHPGELTASYVGGRRKPLLAPLQLFLIVNVIFFGFQSLFRTNVLSSPLRSQLHAQFYSELAQRLVPARIEALHTTEADYAPRFDHAVIVNAKSLVVLLTPPVALVAALLFFTQRRPFVTHVVFALHFYAYWLLVFCAVTPLLAVAIVILMRGFGVPMTTNEMDLTVSVVQLAIGASYLFIATERVYAEHGGRQLLKALALMVTAGATVLGYRFAVFLVTLYTTGAH